jgi:hypothetical protein
MSKRNVSAGAAMPSAAPRLDPATLPQVYTLRVKGTPRTGAAGRNAGGLSRIAAWGTPPGLFLRLW